MRRLIALSQETKVFLLMAAFGFIVAAIYWFVSYEPAGTILLAGFGLATAVIALLLARSDPTRRRAAAPRAEPPAPPTTDIGQADTTVSGTEGIDRPFVDETGRLPDPTIAPFAVGAGLALAATGLVFGLAPVIVGALPLAWGAWTWLSSAGEELIATEVEDAAG
ncbi:MAG TPA: hypothetical protein VFV72_05330 [Candidatus Limnocylindrales bacterium]|nr:hypothetical protein [Candidatus Limnocylindrales bacterium]